MAVYDRVVIMNERDLDPVFRARYHQRLRHDVRGFGYWVWKPQVLRQVMATCKEGDVVHYADIGCHLNSVGRARMEEYLSLADGAPTGVLAFSLHLPTGHEARRWHGHPPDNLRERFWTKRYLLDHLDVRHQTHIVDSPQMISGTFLLRCGAPTRSLIDVWASVWEQDFALVDDTRSPGGEAPEFIQHRHDQSVFSILCKLRGVATLSAVECEYPGQDGRWDWQALAAFPIHCRRDLQRSWIARQLDRWRR